MLAMRVPFASMGAPRLLAVPMEDALTQDAPTVTDRNFREFSEERSTYKRGEDIRRAMTFSEAVVVTGTPRYALEMEGSGRLLWADYNATLSNGSRLIFVYIVQAEDCAPAGVRLIGASVLNNGTIRSADDMTDTNLYVKYSDISGKWRPQGIRSAFKVDGSQVDSSPSPAPTASIYRSSVLRLLTISTNQANRFASPWTSMAPWS